MTQAYGHKFVSNFGQKDNGVWFEALRDLTRCDLSYGFFKLMRNMSVLEQTTHEAWPPNLKEFRSYCVRQYSDFGLLKPSQAFREVEDNRYSTCALWSHPLVVHVAEVVGALDHYEHLRKVNDTFIELYEFLCWRYMRGEAIAVNESVLQDRYYRKIPKLVIGGTALQKTLQYQEEVPQ